MVTPSSLVHDTVYIPQEIIDLIINEIASGLNGPYARRNPNDPGSSMSTLKQCALVSRAFSFPSRQHIFSNIQLEFNMPGDRTKDFSARNLSKVLERAENSHLLSAIRTVKSNLNLIFDPSPRSGSWRSRNKFLRGISNATQKFISPPKDNMLEIYHLLSKAPLEKCVFMTEGGFLRWTIPTFPALVPIQQMCTGHSLKVLHLVYVADLDYQLFIAILSSPNLRELVLSNVILNGSSEYDQSFLVGRSPRRTLAHLEKLGTVHVGKSIGSAIVPIVFFTDLAPWFPDNAEEGSLKFRGLKEFSTHVSRRGNRLQTMWQGILNMAESLEVLELQDNFRMVTNDPVFHADGPILLDHLKSLKTLLYWVEALQTPFVDAVTAMELKLKVLASLLSKAVTSPLGLQTIRVQLYIQLSLASRPDGLASFTSRVQQRTEKWSALDAALCNEFFYDLKEVEFEVKLFFCDSSHVSYKETDEGPVDVRSLFPQLSVRTPPVAIRVQLWSVFSPVELNWYQV